MVEIKSKEEYFVKCEKLKEIQISVFIKKELECSHTHLFTYCLWLLRVTKVEL